jgi:hypothetical protein
MGKKPVAQTFFHPSGCADETPPPQIPKHTDHNGNPDNVEGILQQRYGVDSIFGNIVDSPFYDAGDEKLEKIDDNQTDKTQENETSLFDEIRLY